MFKNIIPRKQLIILLASISFLLTSNGLFAQEDTIRLVNPSFEDFPRPGQSGVATVEGWYDCGRINFPTETPPDLHPNLVQPIFGVVTPAQDGETYIGIVVRDNDTWESVSQRLSAAMEVGSCYSFSLYLARSANYLSAVGDRDSNVPQNRDAKEMINHNTPASLRIWGGNGYCDKSELLASTSEIPHERWIEYQYKFAPSKRITYLTLEVFYKTPTPFPYNGNLLIDNLSSIALTPCQEETPIVEFINPKKNKIRVNEKSYTFRAKVKHIKDKENITIVFNNNLVEEFYFDSRTGGLAIPERLRKGDNKLVVRAKNSTGRTESIRMINYGEEEIAAVIINEPVAKPSVAVVAPKPKSSLLERSELVKGKTIRIDKLYFPADSSTIKRESYGAMEQVFDFLKENPDVVVEIGGHTNNVPPPDYCFRLSSERAKAVASYLVQKGIGTERLRYKGYGKTKPVASNKTKDGRMKNQRVEIKILSFDG